MKLLELIHGIYKDVYEKLKRLGCKVDVLEGCEWPWLTLEDKGVMWSFVDQVGSLSLQALSNLHYLFSGFMDYFWSRKLNISNFGPTNRDSYEVPKESVATSSASDGKKGRTVAVTTEDMQKRRNDVKARTTLLSALPDEHQLRFSKYKTAQELWAAILKIFGGNEATRKTKKNQLQQQYGNFKAEGKETPENSSGNEEVNTTGVPTTSTQVSPASANVVAASISLDTACASITSQSNGSQIKYEDINQIDEDDIEEMDIKWNMALQIIRADRYWKKTGKKISIQGTDVVGFDKSNVECFNYHKMGHFARECRAPRSQERGRRDNYRQGSKVEEQAPKSLMAIDEVAPTKFALMAKSDIDNEVFDNSLCSKACKKNTDSLNSQITELSKKLGDTNNMLYHYKLGLSEVKARQVEFKNQEIKFCEKIRGLEFSVECKANRIENLSNELETLKKEKEVLDSKLSGFKLATKDLDNLIGSQRSDKIKEGLGYSKVIQNSNSSASENGESTGSILSKPEIKFVKPTDSPTVAKTDKKETVMKPTVKYAELYRKNSKRSNVRGNQRNWNNLKSQQLGKNFVMKKACYNCSGLDHLSYDCGKWVNHGRTWAKNNYTHKSRSPRTVFYKLADHQ
nr:hypothetical protein [Tanacetum cinerariifolium]